jgi:hypothetical protein
MAAMRKLTVTLELTADEAMALRTFVARLRQATIEEILGEFRWMATLADGAASKLSTAIYIAQERKPDRAADGERNRSA